MRMWNIEIMGGANEEKNNRGKRRERIQFEMSNRKNDETKRMLGR